MFGDVLRKAKDAIRGSSRPTTAAGFLRPIDTDWIARELDLDRVAVERGAQDLPTTASNSLDGTEQAIVQRIESEWSWQGAELINNLRAYAQRLVAYSIDAEFAKLEIKAKNTLSQLRAAHHRAEAELAPLREQYVDRRNELSAFREKYRIRRPAQFSSSRWTTFGLLVLLISFESVLNGFFFAKGSAFGLVGGVGIAIGVSVFNVLVSFVLGLGPTRWLNFRNPLIKLLAFLIVLSGLAGLVTLHGFAAHYRDAVAAVGEDGALNAATESIRSKTWRLADINSYYLFGLGLIAGILALYKGYTFDDPHPLYGKKTRAANEAHDDYSDEHSVLFDDLDDIKTLTLQEINDGITRIPLFPQQAANIRAQRAALVQSFRGYESSVETATNQLLSRYRDANRRRRNSDVPSYFDRAWRLPHSFLEGAEVKTLIAEQTETSGDVSSMLSELRRLSQELIDEFDSLLKAYPHLTTMEPIDGARQANS